MNKSQQKLIQWALKNNAEALNCAQHIIASSQILDDLWDGDKPVTGDQCVQMVLSMSVDIHKNAFFIKHRDSMTQIVERAILQWLECNDIERNSEASEKLRTASYILRSSITDLVIQMAYLVGGRAWGRQAAKAIRTAIFEENESFEEYLAELSKAEED